MKACEISTPGEPAVLKLTTRPLPSPAAGEVLVKVMAAGVNRPDVMQRKGLYPPPPGASDIPGLEIAGTIVGLGSSVTEHAVGDNICALVPGGGYAEYCLASAKLCLPIPQDMTLRQSAALPETFFTVWSNVFDRGRLVNGETLLLHGGSGGIGVAAIQLAKSFGARVFITAGSDEKCGFCQKLGADGAINYREKDFVQEIRQLTQGNGVNLILDMIGGDYFPRNIECLAPEGRLVQIAVQNGPKSEINLLPVMLNRLTITGSTLRARSVEFKAEIAKNLLKNVWPLLENGRIKPIIHSVFPLTEAAKAHELMESSRHIGKIILTM
ncbi:MAG: NAD(P)H-quinone oxidoreductase [Gammaproteobacteria bacterium]